MLEHSITFTDLNGNERTEKYYFHYSENELMKMDLDGENGLMDKIRKIAYTEASNIEIIEIFESIIAGAYGVKSPDGLRFVKDEDEIKAMGKLTFKQFTETPAYNKMFLELFGETGMTMVEFLSGVIPKNISDNPDVQKQLKDIKEGNVDVKAVLSGNRNI